MSCERATLPTGGHGRSLGPPLWGHPSAGEGRSRSARPAARRGACSTRWPGRPRPCATRPAAAGSRRGRRAPAGRLSAMNGHAPWLRGSSWTQTTSASGYFASSAGDLGGRAAGASCSTRTIAVAVSPRLLARGLEVVDDLAAGEQHPGRRRPRRARRGRAAPGGRCPSVKSSAAARRGLEPQHRLRGEDDERPARAGVGLAAQQVEVADAGVEG